MLMFTAEGLLRGDNRAKAKGIGGGVVGCTYHAYLRWLETQVEDPRYPFPEVLESWLLRLPELHARRAPGNTCLSALRSGRRGDLHERINNSKGCGGVTRVAPIGLAGIEPFQLGGEVAAITHGHHSGYLAAGFLAAVIANLIDGKSLHMAVEAARGDLRRHPDHEECLDSVDRALHLVGTAPRTAETVERLGQGWVAEEALTISIYCALVADGFEDGVVLAVNHSGDSDSTGAITGNILGALYGQETIPRNWLEPLELWSEVEELAMDLYRHFGDPANCPDEEEDWEKYPGW